MHYAECLPTNCYYCYADKRTPMDCLIEYKRICEIIQEAHELGVVTFDLIGGEVFLYAYWKELIAELRKYHYRPLLTTKIPLKEEDIKYLKETDNHTLQISLDSMIPDTLKKTLRTNEAYLKKIKDMFHLLQKYGINVAVHTVVSLKNSTVEDMQSIYYFLLNFNNILYWKPDIANESIYSEPQHKGKIRPTEGKLNVVIEYFESIADSCTFPLIYGGLDLRGEEEDNRKDITPSFQSRMDSFLDGAICTGNFSKLFILPDGKVTICEELYWHPKFIIGDVNVQNLQEIWNSEKALLLYKIKQEEFSNSSACRTCGVFLKCRELKQVCYRDIIRKYGSEHWDYPDENCPKAPKI